jgi:hypothetical protein
VYFGSKSEPPLSVVSFILQRVSARFQVARTAAAAGPSAASEVARSVAASLVSRAALVKTTPLLTAAALRALLPAALPAVASDLWQHFRSGSGEVSAVSAAAVTPVIAVAATVLTKAAAVEKAGEEAEPLPPTGDEEEPAETRVESPEL